MARTRFGQRRTHLHRTIRFLYAGAVAPSVRKQRAMGRMLLEPIFYALVLLGLLRLLGIGTLYSRSSAMGTPQTPAHRHNMLRAWRCIHGMVVLDNGHSRATYRNSYAGMVVGILHAERALCHFRGLPTLHMHKK
mgnify:CR=1 FL=1